MELRSPHVIATALLLATAAAGLAASGSSRHEVDSPLATNRPTSFAAAGGRPVSFRGTLDRTAVLRGGDGVARVELVIAAPADPLAQVTRRPTDLVVVLDRSGSMSGEKIQQAREAVRHLVQELGARQW